MDNARSFPRGHKVGSDDVAVVLVHRQEGVQWLVMLADQFFGAEALQHGVFTLHSLLQQAFGQDELFAILLYKHVLHMGMYSQGSVAGQCPGCGCPGQEVDARFVTQRELDVDGGILDLLIALRDLVIGERSLTAWAVGHAFKALV